MDLLSPCVSASSTVLNLATVQFYGDSDQPADLRENPQFFMSQLSLQAGKIYSNKSNSEKDAEGALRK